MLLPAPIRYYVNTEISVYYFEGFQLYAVFVAISPASTRGNDSAASEENQDHKYISHFFCCTQHLILAYAYMQHSK